MVIQLKKKNYVVFCHLRLIACMVMNSLYQVTFINETFSEAGKHTRTVFKPCNKGALKLAYP